jgi:hypothetical protein
MKFGMIYKDFNINCDYSQQTGTTFKRAGEYFKKKVDSFLHQDINSERAINKKLQWKILQNK